MDNRFVTAEEAFKPLTRAFLEQLRKEYLKIPEAERDQYKVTLTIDPEKCDKTLFPDIEFRKARP